MGMCTMAEQLASCKKMKILLAWSRDHANKPCTCRFQCALLVQWSVLVYASKHTSSYYSAYAEGGSV